MEDTPCGVRMNKPNDLIAPHHQPQSARNPGLAGGGCHGLSTTRPLAGTDYGKPQPNRRHGCARVPRHPAAWLRVQGLGQGSGFRIPKPYC